MKPPEPTYHDPKPIKSDDIYEMYTRVIEESFHESQQMFKKTIHNHRSIYAKVNTDFVALEKKPINIIVDQANKTSRMTNQYSQVQMNENETFSG